VEKAYRDGVEGGGKAPRAPGMKYKHYSPRAKVVLYEAGWRGSGVDWEDLKDVWENRGEAWKDGDGVVGVVRTGRWPVAGGLPWEKREKREIGQSARVEEEEQQTFEIQEGEAAANMEGGVLMRVTVLDLDLGKDIKGIAQGLFSALRELDRQGAEVIFVEGVDDGDDIAAAVMNRLRKAATITRE
jgi:L-threonylcarbamoyladenylate synthase